MNPGNGGSRSFWLNPAVKGNTVFGYFDELFQIGWTHIKANAPFKYLTAKFAEGDRKDRRVKNLFSLRSPRLLCALCG